MIGGGFIGSEIAASLAANDCRVTMVFPERGIASRVLPAELSEFVTGYYRERGVEILADETVEAATAGSVTTGSGRTIEADVVIAGLGIEPATDLAEAAGLAVDNGIVVDELGRVQGRDDVFAAGDVARFPVAALGRTLQGRARGPCEVAWPRGRREHGGRQRPVRPPAVLLLRHVRPGLRGGRRGRFAARDREVWEEPNRKGIVAYVDDARRPRGFLFWNVWDHVEHGRELIWRESRSRRRMLV